MSIHKTLTRLTTLVLLLALMATYPVMAQTEPTDGSTPLYADSPSPSIDDTAASDPVGAWPNWASGSGGNHSRGAPVTEIKTTQIKRDGQILDVTTITLNWGPGGYCDVCGVTDYKCSVWWDWFDTAWFIDPIPPGHAVLQVSPTPYGLACGVSHNDTYLNGVPAGDGPFTGSCSCNQCWSATYTSAYYANGFPGYVYGGWNSLQIIPNADHICLDRIELAITHLPGELGMTKTASDTVLNPGDPLTYTLSFNNTGSNTALDVVITDIVPITLSNYTYTYAGATITETGGSDYVWQVEDLDQGEWGLITITGIISPDIAPGYAFTNTAIIGTSEGGRQSSVAVQVPLQVLEVDPDPNSHDAPLNTNLTITSNGSISQTTVTSQTLFVHGGFQGHLDGNISFGSIIYDPHNDLHPGEIVQASVTPGVLGQDGAPMWPYVWSFRAAVDSGSGFFTPHPITPTFGAQDSAEVALGDLDGDGDLDALVANYNDQPETVWLNDGAGGFNPHPTTPAFGVESSLDVVLGDLDGDGDLDALVANGNDQAETVWLNDGAGNFTPHPTTPAFGAGISWDVALGDLDGDGDLDALVANFGGQAQTVWLNSGAGDFNPHPSTPAFGANDSAQVSLGDLDGDGDLDALVANNSGQAETVWLNDGVGNFVPHPTTPFLGAGTSRAVALGDLDGDGDLDALVANEIGQAEVVWLNDGAGNFSGHPTTPIFGAEDSMDVALGDLDGDGDLDALVANFNNQAETVWLNNGAGSFSAHFSFGSENSHGAALGDIDDDGDLDALVANWSSQPQTVWLNQNADVAILKTVEPNIAASGDTITYTLGFSNAGNLEAPGVRITDIVPISMTVQNIASSGALITDTGAVPPYVWDVEDLSTGEGGIITITAVLSHPLPAGDILNSATIASSADSNPDNNTSSAILTVYPLLPIYDIQFVLDPVADDASPWLGEMVWTEGVVIADGEVFGSNTRYYIEDPAGGPWSGLYIYNGDDHPLVAEGDAVRLLGLVDEYNGVTQLSILNSAGGLQQVLSSGNPLPAPEIIASGVYTPGGTATAEAYESVLIEFQLATVISDNLGFGEWALDDGSGEAHADDWSDYLTYVPAMSDYYTYIRGVGNYSYDDYKLVPRYDPDVSVISPTLHVNPAAFDVTLDPAAVATHTLSLSNSGSLLAWSLAEVPGVVWLDESPISGSLMPLDSANVDVVFSAPLAAGVYNTDLEIASNDPGAPTVTVPVSLTVNNLPPVADDDAFIVDEDSIDNPLDVLDGDTDDNGDSLTVFAVGAPDQGGSVLNAGSHVTYTPALDFFGSETFSYTVSDGNGGFDTAMVAVTVTNVNDDPDALDDGYAILEDSISNTLDLLANDTYLPDPPETLTIDAVGTPDQGGTVVNNGNDVTYTPVLDFYGTETFTYTISDGNGGLDTATVVVTVTNVNDLPDALDDDYIVPEDTANVLDLLANDTYLPDPSETLTISVVGTPDQGGTVLNAGTHVTYTPALDFYGSEIFSYTISDGNGGLDTATVVVTVTSVNDPPDAFDDGYTVSEDSADNALDLLVNDSDPVEGDPLTVFAVGTPDQGGTVLNAGTHVTYTPALDFYGSETFSYTISDGNGGFDTATVAVTVTNVNDPPDALDDGYTASEDSADNTLDLLSNDSYLPDPPEVLAISAVGTSDQGGTVLNAGSYVTYTPALDFFGSETFSYTISDGNGGFDTATVVVTVTSVNDAPVAADDAYTTSFETALVVAAPGVLANDSDIEGDSLTAVRVSGPPTGTLLLSSDGSFVYTPTLDWSGIITFTYYADDGMDASNLATVTIEVLPPAVVEYTIYLPLVFKGY